MDFNEVQHQFQHQHKHQQFHQASVPDQQVGALIQIHCIDHLDCDDDGLPDLFCYDDTSSVSGGNGWTSTGIMIGSQQGLCQPTPNASCRQVEVCVITNPEFVNGVQIYGTYQHTGFYNGHPAYQRKINTQYDNGHIEELFVVDSGEWVFHTNLQSGPKQDNFIYSTRNNMNDAPHLPYNTTYINPIPLGGQIVVTKDTCFNWWPQY